MVRRVSAERDGCRIHRLDIRPMPARAAASDDRSTTTNHVFVSGESSMRHTRTATIATVAIAFGLALTAIGINRGLPHEIGGIGSKLTVGADTWASGTGDLAAARLPRRRRPAGRDHDAIDPRWRPAPPRGSRCSPSSRSSPA
jgi:hypothetical protein